MEPSAAAIWTLNHRVLTGVLNDCSADLATLGLEPKEFFVLAEIEECRYPAQLATRLATPKASITAYLRTLETLGLVRREIDPSDLRRHRLALTPHGAKVLDRARDALTEAFEHSLTALTERQRTEFYRLLGKIIGA